MIDLSRMNGVRIDADAKRALVGGGAAWAALDAATAEHGLAVSAGRSVTPVSPASPSAVAWVGSPPSRA
jgi:FAD/FMN-containing dehydrogenase